MYVLPTPVAESITASKRRLLFVDVVVLRYLGGQGLDGIPVRLAKIEPGRDLSDRVLEELQIGHALCTCLPIADATAFSSVDAGSSAVSQPELPGGAVLA